MKTIAWILLLGTVAFCAWGVADADRARLAVWSQHWTAGTLDHVNHMLQRGAEYRMKIDRLEAENAGLQGTNDELRGELDAAIERIADFIAAEKNAPKVVRAHCPLIPKPHCLDHIANELNAVEVRR